MKRASRTGVEFYHRAGTVVLRMLWVPVTLRCKAVEDYRSPRRWCDVSRNLTSLSRGRPGVLIGGFTVEFVIDPNPLGPEPYLRAFSAAQHPFADGQIPGCTLGVCSRGP